MSELDQELYIPYLSTAEAIVTKDDGPELFIRSLFAGATDEQIALFTLYTIARLHDGIVQGLEIAGRDPIGEIAAYQMGVEEGLARSKEA
jgi:hypothetical protein